MQVGLSDYAMGNVYMRSMNHKSVEEKSSKKYDDVSAYYAYLKDKYSCLTDPDYKVTISPAFLEKCIKDPEKAELMERSLAHLPIDHQNMTSFWSAQGAEVVNEQWIFDENGNCGGSTSMSVVSKKSSAVNIMKSSTKNERNEKKSTAQRIYDRKRQERKLIEERQAERNRVKEQTKEMWLEDQQLKDQAEKKKLKKQTYQKLAAEEFQARTQNTDRAISAYEKNVMRA